jgi:hypothetical protein
MRPAYLGVWLCAAASLTAAPPAAPRAEDDDAAAPLVQLRFAELRDRDRSGGASAGDEVVLGLRRVLGPRRKVTLSDLPLANAGDGWGEGAVVASVPGRDEISITLGRGAALTLAGTYRPGAASAAPSLVRTRSGPVPVLPAPADRRAFAGDRFADGPELRAFHGQLHAHTGYSDGLLTPADAYAAARAQGLQFFAVTDHLEQLDDAEWAETRAAAARAEAPGDFAALYGYEWGGVPTLYGWLNHVNVIGSDERFAVFGVLGLSRLYEVIGRLPGAHVVAQWNHPGMVKGALGRNNWNAFAYDAAADLRVKLVMVETRSDNDEDNREDAGLVPALDRGWHVAPKGEEDNHIANWGRSGRRTGLWLPELGREAVLSGLGRMATFYTDDPGASLKLTGDGEWLMGSTLYGPGPHRLTVAVAHARRIAQVTGVEIVSVGGRVVARHPGGPTPLSADFTVDPEQDAYFFARVVLESAETRMISAPLYVDR